MACLLYCAVQYTVSANVDQVPAAGIAHSRSCNHPLTADGELEVGETAELTPCEQHTAKFAVRV